MEQVHTSAMAMSTPVVVLGWIALGITVTLVGMILPFRRGVLGVAMNIGASVAGAVLGGFLGYAIGAYDRVSAPVSFAFAAAAAILANLLVHVVVLRRRPA